jgi:hypothetical protein
VAEPAEAAEAARIAEAEEIRERGICHFLHDVAGNSSTPVTEDEDFRPVVDTVVIRPGMTIVDEGDALTESPKEDEFLLQEGHVGLVAMPESVAPYAWSSTWAQARVEAAQRQAEEERLS